MKLPLDRHTIVCRYFLRKVGTDDLSAITKFNLAPLHARRYIAMFAVIHRAVLRWGRQFSNNSSSEVARICAERPV